MMKYQMFATFIICMFFGLQISHMKKVIPNRHECVQLKAAVETSGGLEYFASVNGVVIDVIQGLYKDCLLAEEGIRFKRYRKRHKLLNHKQIDYNYII
ncbi:unnamed protein product [Oppiella nova]|uniref:Uncharacterized protein n=1 Tax=Oppiella nova TaxID=334625 RepID=A0A7R9QVF9_9ACAR|nr:unnamed protein product [Oppiella nova]CAG2177033.1 unnamed protein product [Oppiella nova]